MRRAARFIGLDLTDAYAAKPRKVDVAIVDSRRRCAFSALPAFIAGESVTSWLAPVTSGFASGDRLIIDGPLALARPGEKIREAERLLAVAGKTPDVLAPSGSKSPYAGFIRGSLDLAKALLGAGWKMPGESTAIGDASLFEAYPGGSWTKLAGRRLPKKTCAEGRSARAKLLLSDGLIFERQPENHDELDAALCAWLGWKLLCNPDAVELIGPCSFEEAGEQREGSILQARVTART